MGQMLDNRAEAGNDFLQAKLREMVSWGEVTGKVDSLRRCWHERLEVSRPWVGVQAGVLDRIWWRF